MDATRLYRYTAYCPMDFNGVYDDECQLSLTDAWQYYINGGGPLFMACDALSLEHKSCVLDFEDLTDNEYADLQNALYG